MGEPVERMRVLIHGRYILGATIHTLVRRYAPPSSQGEKGA